MKVTVTATQSNDLLLDALRGAGALTRRDLVEHTGLSVATVARSVSRLIEAGFLAESGPNLTGGRPSHEVSLVPDAATVLALDVADQHTETALVGWTGEVLESTRHPAVGLPPEDRLAHTLRIAETAADDYRRKTAVVATGVSIPGPVRDNGLVDFAPALRWQHIPMGDLLTERLRHPVAVHNDANLIAVAETHHGAMQGVTSLLALAVFHGVGAGIVIDGQLWNGHSGYAGQIGRMLLDLGSLGEVYPEFGGLESQLGSVGIQRRILELGIEVDPEREIFEQLFDAAEGTPLAELAEAVLDQFALGLVNACALLDPGAIVLGGRFTPLAAALAPQLRRRLSGRVLRVPELIGESTHHAGAVLGAARMAFDAVGPLSAIARAAQRDVVTRT